MMAAGEGEEAPSLEVVAADATYLGLTTSRDGQYPNVVPRWWLHAARACHDAQGT